MHALPQDRTAATRNGRGFALRSSVAGLMEFVEAEMRRLPPGPRNKLVHTLADLVARDLDEIRPRRDTLDSGSSMSTDPDIGLQSDLVGMYYLG